MGIWEYVFPYEDHRRPAGRSPDPREEARRGDAHPAAGPDRTRAAEGIVFHHHGRRPAHPAEDQVGRGSRGGSPRPRCILPFLAARVDRVAAVIAVDTNLLVYAHRAGCPEHDAARRAIEDAANDAGGWGIP